MGKNRYPIRKGGEAKVNLYDVLKKKLNDFPERTDIENKDDLRFIKQVVIRGFLKEWIKEIEENV